jgi:hypothetical protein
MKMLNSTDERNAIKNRDINHSMEKNLKYRGSNIVIEDPKVILRDKETPSKKCFGSIDRLLPLFVRNNIHIKRSLNKLEKESIQIKQSKYLLDKR